MSLSNKRAVLTLFSMCAAVAAWAGMAAGQDTKPAAVDDGPSYKVGKLQVVYAREHAEQPSLAAVQQLSVTLGKTAQGYVAPRAGVENVTISLAGVSGDQAFFASAIRRINESIVGWFNQRGLAGIYVAPHSDDIDPRSGQDKRAAGNTTLRLAVWSAAVSRIRTLGAGERVPNEERINNPVHARIRENSPVKEKDLLDKAKLEDYVYLLNRQPGRRVDAAITSAEQPGEVALDYLVTENKPWLAYFQASNTGTKSTDECRYRFGFIHNQLTNNDDVLSVDYTTSCPLDSDPAAQSFSASYEAPLCKTERLRYRVYFQWSKFQANVSSPTGGENFTGYTWRTGGELIANICQKKQLFIDAIAGLAWWKIYVNNATTEISGAQDAFLPYVGLRAERVTETDALLAQITLEKNCSGIAGGGASDYVVLGRTDPDPDWFVLRWDAMYSFYLEPLCNPEKWRNVDPDPAKWQPGQTLAHEVAFMFRGQYAFDYRLIPQNEGVAGGLFTVRGYPESIAAGDTTLIGTAEYRLHIPRLFRPVADPSKTRLPLVGAPFRWSPQTVYGRPDWDLIARGFLDAGRTIVNDPLSFEKNQTLVGTGVGLELQFTRYFNIRMDYGWALQDVSGESQRVEAGDSRLHIVATIVY